MTAVSTIPKDQRRAIGDLPPEIQQALELRKQRNLVAAQIAGMSWGEKLDGETRRAVADWGQQFRIDVATEIFILGNRIYRNADFYLRRMGEMIGEGLVEYAVADHIEDDPRLKERGIEGEGEYTRRLRERIRYSIPDAAKCAVAFRVKLWSLDREIVGVKWTGGGTRKNDPVGEAFPVESAESRAARRAMRQLTSHLPPAAREAENALDKSTEIISARIAESKQRVNALNAEMAPRPLALPPQNDPYGEPAPIAPVETAEPERVTEAANAAPVAAAAAEPEVKRSEAYRYKLPFGPMRGTAIGNVPPADLEAWYKFALEAKEPDSKTRGLIAAYEELQQERDLERGE